MSKINGGIYESFRDDFHWWLTNWLIFWFFPCLYDDKEISDKFVNSESLLKKKKIELEWLDKLAEKSGYTREYLLSTIKNQMTKMDGGKSGITSLQGWKNYFESGKASPEFRGIIIGQIEDFVIEFNRHIFLYFSPVPVVDGCPDFIADFQLRKFDTKDPFIYDPAYPGMTQAEIADQQKKEADALAAAQKKAEEAARLEAESKKKRMLLGGGIGLAMLALVSIKK